MPGSAEVLGSTGAPGDVEQIDRAIRGAQAERMLRWKMLAWFGIFFFASYALLFSMALSTSNPLIALRTGLSLDWVYQLAFYAVPALLGTLMFISVFYKPMFHVLTIAVVLALSALGVFGNIFSLFSSNMLIMLLLQPFQNYIMFLYGFNWLPPAINLICWLLPFALYYALNWRRSRSSARPPMPQSRA
ncbi:MAG: hypothetical protein LBU31_03170 [Coriobacteriales bacterium]|jgi:hypothetical protein|nr:hypothetical protein [Coriobacteriales bacterium]